MLAAEKNLASDILFIPSTPLPTIYEGRPGRVTSAEGRAGLNSHRYDMSRKLQAGGPSPRANRLAKPATVRAVRQTLRRGVGRSGDWLAMRLLDAGFASIVRSASSVGSGPVATL
jgi:hypothetical protein